MGRGGGVPGSASEIPKTVLQETSPQSQNSYLLFQEISASQPRAAPMNYDAILVVSFGGPESPEDVIPFLENVLRGRNVPRERMLAVAEHYYHFGGKSPINVQNRALIAGLQRELANHGPQLPIYWGNRNWHPLIADTLRQMRADGVQKAVAFVTSIFTSHSVPLSMAETSDYQKQLQESCRLVAESVGIADWRLVYQSRSGAPGQPWLEPDIADVLRKADPAANLVVVPIGFVSDHIEVIYDLDTEAQAIARERGVNMARAATVGVHPKFLQMIRELIEERLGLCQPRAIGQYPPSHDVCRLDCCPAPARRPSSALSDSSPRAI